MMQLKILTSLFISLGFLSLNPVIAEAQSSNLNQKEPFQSNEINPLYGDSGFNPMDLIHNANLLNGRSGAEFIEDTDKNLDNAADTFKKQQLERLMQMKQSQEMEVKQ